MNDLKLLPNDPQLTAYALGELDADERAAFEQLLREDSAARAAVEEIRTLAGEVVAALSEEKAIPLVPSPREDPYSAANRRRLLRFPRVTYLVSGLIAASIVVVLALQRPDYGAREARVQQERRAAELKAREMAAAMPQFVEIPLAEESEGAGLLAATAGSAPSIDVGAGLGLIEQSKRMPGPPGLREPGRFGMRDKSRGEIPEGMVRGAVWRKGERATLVTYSRVAARPPARDVVQEKSERYAHRPESGFLAAREHPVSTFSADVDTASYANVRRFIQGGQLPPIDAVRIEEMLNYFPYRYEAPRPVAVEATEAAPFAATMEVAEAPWAEGHRLVRIGLKGREVAMGERGAANLVFLLDVSGSMNAANKLPLVKESLRLLLGRLRADDRVAIVTYAGASGLALASTPVANARAIVAALDEL
ncbi:MAG TPA: von Willebrand factor type A domain-containing protein, partial [Opitutus sp.]|nr:von Willebrand factor type A domain-containing protein [Opitutus sp.]